MKHFLRVEAVNIYASIFDTDQISVIRGGSLLLKKAIDDITTRFKKELVPISTGASIGLYRLYSHADPENTKKEIIEFLNDPKGHYRYFTFVVAMTNGENFQTIKEVLIAKCRLLQLKQPTISPDSIHGQSNLLPCQLDGKRRAHISANISGMQKIISDFADIKLRHGRDQRDKLHENELQAFISPDNASDSAKPEAKEKAEIENLQKLKLTCDLPSLSANPKYPNLDGKIAVIYFDGNGFSKIQEELVSTDEDQIAFDQAIKRLRREFLAKLLQHCIDVENEKQSSWFTVNPEKNSSKTQTEEEKLLRLETLLWGGDEMLLVVPAWQGFAVLHLFYQTSADWEIVINGQKKPLKHSGGIVFCQQNSPIYIMRKLAQSLADRIKEHDKNSRHHSFFDYLILESIDYPAESLDSFFQHRYGDLANYRTYLSAEKLVKADFQQFRMGKNSQIANLNKILPKSQVYALALAAREIRINIVETDDIKILKINHDQDFEEIQQRLHELPRTRDERQLLEDTIEKLGTLLSPEITDLQPENNQIALTTITRAIMWLNLVQCWDYLWPEDNI
jgi:hypothetical protein